MYDENSVKQGWEFAAKLAGVNYGTIEAEKYVNEILAEIQAMENNINNHPYRNLPASAFQGYVAEEWTAGTFNVNAVANRVAERAYVLHETTLGSVDVRLQSGMEYSLKSYATGEKSAIEQARLNLDTRTPLYQNQSRWVPNDQLEDAKNAAHIRSIRNMLTRPDVSNAYSETEEMLTDVIRNPDDVVSREIDRKSLEEMAKQAQKGEFSAVSEGVDLASVLTDKLMIERALEAGYSAATISAIISLAPEIYKTVDYLIKHGEINVNQIKKMGEKAISSGAEGFLRGSISCTLTLMCEKGLFGEALKSVNPTLVGTMVVITMGTIKNSILVAAGKMTAREMAGAFVDSAIISAGFYGSVKLGTAIGTALNFEAPIVGYLLGSLIGCAFAAVYNVGKNKFISFCIESGFTFFGLVEQDYSLPEDVLVRMGVDVTPIIRTEIKRTEISHTPIQVTQQDLSEYETVEMNVVKRGIIGVNKIGYTY